VVLASGGYPGKYDTGKPIALPPSLPANVTVYHAGDALRDGRLVTAGGRVLGVTAAAPTLAQAIGDAYAAAETIHFDGAYLRRDIGRRALAAQEG
jgi:phosphoribosylamine--glycine ligase